MVALASTGGVSDVRVDAPGNNSTTAVDLLETPL
jgi:hypothetical protein